MEVPHLVLRSLFRRVFPLPVQGSFPRQCFEGSRLMLVALRLSPFLQVAWPSMVLLGRMTLLTPSPTPSGYHCP